MNGILKFAWVRKVEVLLSHIDGDTGVGGHFARAVETTHDASTWIYAEVRV
jgi:hypothetical protein